METFLCTFLLLLTTPTSFSFSERSVINVIMYFFIPVLSAIREHME